MKIAVFSDIHANLQALEAIIEDIKKQNVDRIICLGDIISKGPNPKECLDLIIENNIEMLPGNHELYYLRGVEIDNLISDIEKEHQQWIWSTLNEKHREFLEKCPLEIKVNAYGKKLSFKHFLVENENADYPFYLIDILNKNIVNDVIESLDEDYIFIGHEHRTFEINLENKQLTDIGSSGCTDDEDTFYTMVTIDEESVKIEQINIKYDRQKFEEVFKESNYPEKDLIAGIFFGL